MPKLFADLEEREILALAISLEEEDSHPDAKKHRIAGSEN